MHHFHKDWWQLAFCRILKYFFLTIIFDFFVTVTATLDDSCRSSIKILKEDHICILSIWLDCIWFFTGLQDITYVSNLIAIYSKWFFWIFKFIFLLILPLCSIYRHGGHDGWLAGSSDITFKGNPLRMMQAKFGLNWPSGFKGEVFEKVYTNN